MKLLANSWKFVRSALLLALACAVVVLILPSKARSQLGLDPCCAIISAGLDSISGLLKGVVAKPLASIQQIEQQAADFERQVVWPLTAINQARGLAVLFSLLCVGIPGPDLSDRLAAHTLYLLRRQH